MSALIGGDGTASPDTAGRITPESPLDPLPAEADEAADNNSGDCNTGKLSSSQLAT